MTMLATVVPTSDHLGDPDGLSLAELDFFIESSLVEETLILP